MSVKLLSSDAKQLLEQRIKEWRIRVCSFEVRGKVMSDLNAAKLAFLTTLKAETMRKIWDFAKYWEKTNDEAIAVGGSAEALKEIFKKEIRGVVVLCNNAFFEVKGLCSDEEAVLLVQEKIRKEKSKIDYLKSRQNTHEGHLEYERVRIPENVRNEVWRRDQAKCVQCGSVRNLEFDHLIPVSKGGSNTTRNLQLLCESCNRRKSDNIG